MLCLHPKYFCYTCIGRFFQNSSQISMKRYKPSTILLRCLAWSILANLPASPKALQPSWIVEEKVSSCFYFILLHQFLLQYFWKSENLDFGNIFFFFENAANKCWNSRLIPDTQLCALPKTIELSHSHELLNPAIIIRFLCYKRLRNTTFQ